MTSELEQKFYGTFDIKPKRQCYYSDTHCKNHCNKDCVNFYMKPKYPEITAEKLLEMICIYNEFQNNCDNSFIPTSINNLKGNFLAVIIQAIKDETANRYFCNDVGKLKHQIQQLFKD